MFTFSGTCPKCHFPLERTYRQHVNNCCLETLQERALNHFGEKAQRDPFELLSEGMIDQTEYRLLFRLAMLTALSWDPWVKGVVVLVEKGMLEAAANVLSQHTVLEDHTYGDTLGQDGMYLHPSVLANAQELWLHIAPLMCPEYVEETRRFLNTYGWDLQPLSHYGVPPETTGREYRRIVSGAYGKPQKRVLMNLAGKALGWIWVKPSDTHLVHTVAS